MKNKFSSSYQNQIVNAIKLFFKIAKESTIEIDKIHRPKREKVLPNVLSKEEVFKIIDTTENLKHKALLALIYSAGLRISEALNMKPKDIDSVRMLIHVKNASGQEIGRIEQEVLESLGNILEGQNIYSVYDANNNLIGKSKSDMIIKNNVEIYDNSDKLVARFHKPAIQFGDRWKCEITPSNIDKRLLVFIPAYVSSSSGSSSSSSNKSKK
jgi:integrase